MPSSDRRAPPCRASGPAATQSPAAAAAPARSRAQVTAVQNDRVSPHVSAAPVALRARLDREFPALNGSALSGSSLNGGAGAAEAAGGPATLAPVSALSDRDVLRIAELARLALSAEERARLGRELAAILTYVEQIGAIDTSGIEPTSHVQLDRPTLRPDEPTPSLARDGGPAQRARRRPRTPGCSASRR